MLVLASLLDFFHSSRWLSSSSCSCHFCMARSFITNSPTLSEIPQSRAQCEPRMYDGLHLILFPLLCVGYELSLSWPSPAETMQHFAQCPFLKHDRLQLSLAQVFHYHHLYICPWHEIDKLFFTHSYNSLPDRRWNKIGSHAAGCPSCTPLSIQA